MLADNRYQYGIDFKRPQQELQERHNYVAEEEEKARKSQPQIITKDLTLSSTKYNSNNSNDEDDDIDVADEDIELGHPDDMVAQTDVVINAEDVDSSEDGAEGEQSTLHLPHARWPNHWSDINAQLSETSPTVTYKWLTSPWSECSQRCGAAGSGLRVSTLTQQHNIFVN